MNSALITILSALLAAVVISLFTIGSGLTPTNNFSIVVLTVILLGGVWWIFKAVAKYQKRKLEGLILAGAQLQLQLDDDKPSKNAINPKPKYANELARKSARLRYLFVGSLGEGGPTVRIFQHTYTVSTGQSAYTINHRAGYIQVPEDWPTTRVCTKRKGKMKFGTWKDKKAIPLEVEEFNRRFVVKSFDADFALILLNPDLQEALLTVANKTAGAWHIEAGRMWYIEKGSMTALSLPATLKHFRLFVDYIYPDLWEG